MPPGPPPLGIFLRPRHSLPLSRGLRSGRHFSTTPFPNLHLTKRLLSENNDDDSKNKLPSQTDPSVHVRYPGDAPLPSSPMSRKARASIPQTQPPSLHPELQSLFSLAGRLAVVTGGARGLGLVMARGLAMAGADVALVDLNVDEASTAASILSSSLSSTPSAPPPRITAHRCDVSCPPSVHACHGEVLAAHRPHGAVDILVTSAGFTENHAATEYPVERARRLWSVNVDGTWLWATEVARGVVARRERRASAAARGGGEGGSRPDAVERGASLIFIGSMSGSIVNVPQPQTPYNAAKAAVRHLAASLAVEWAGEGIRVNCVAPGYMATELTKKILEDRPDLAEQWTSRIPTGRMGKPEELIGVVTFLGSDASSYVTGACLNVDGGYTVL